MDKFAFGKNWQKFVEKSFSLEALENSKKGLIEFLKTPNLSGLTFLDVGSGSGLHSLSALELAASSVTSVDVDKESVKCALDLKSNSNHQDRWIVKEGSLLDSQFISSLDQFDIVYCWGVAHHTGSMWEALEHLVLPMKPGGKLFVAIYNHVEGKLGSSMWFRIKKFYNESSFFIKKIMEGIYISWSFLNLIIRFKNPFSVIRNYKRKRGMAWTTDIVDWLGGFPYEYASVKEIFSFYNTRGFRLENIKTTNYIGCNQFLFVKEK